MANADRRRVLRAGPLYAEYHRGDLWSARFGDVPVLDRLYVRIRDQSWGTVPMRAELTALDRAGPSFRVLSRLSWGSERWATGTLEVTGSASELFACATITFHRRVCLQRAGLNLHHPLASTVGRRYHWVNGRSSGSGTFPAVIHPQLRDQARYLPMIGPFGRLTIGTSPDALLTMDFTGAQFETEDQRNWTDASFKTYGPPVDRQEPRWHEAGSAVQQTVLITARAPGPAATRPPRREPSETAGAAGTAGTARIAGPAGAAEPVKATRTGTAGAAGVARMTRAVETAGTTGAAVIRIGAGTEPALPPVGVTASSLWPAPDGGPRLADEPDLAVAEAGLDHVRVEVWPESAASVGQMRHTLAVINDRGIPLELGLRGGAEDPGWLGKVLSMAAAVPVRAVLALGAGTEPAPPGFAAMVSDLAREAGIGAPVAAGTAGHFSEINRSRDVVRHAGPVVWSTNPQVHESDDVTVMQAAAMVGQTVASAAQIWPGQDLAISSIRFAADPAEATIPAGGAVPAGAATDPPAARLAGRPPAADPRAGRPFAAAWLVAVLAGLTGTRCDWLTVDLPLVTARPALHARPTPSARLASSARLTPPATDTQTATSALAGRPGRARRPAPTPAAHVLRALRLFRGLPLARVEVTGPGLAVLAARPPGGGIRLLVANLTRRRSVPVLLPGLAKIAGTGASEPYTLNLSSGGQAEIILGPYEVIHILAISR
jgi:hypothetical protein